MSKSYNINSYLNYKPSLSVTPTKIFSRPKRVTELKTVMLKGLLSYYPSIFLEQFEWKHGLI